jgi:hypothetical protein
MSENMIDNKNDNEIQQIDENYQMPVEQETDVIDELVNKKLPTDINKWFFVVIISGITTIFGILMKLQDDRLTDSEKNATEWKANANEWKQAYYGELKAKEALQQYYNENKDCAARVQNAKELLEMFDSSSKNRVKIDSLKQILK